MRKAHGALIRYLPQLIQHPNTETMNENDQSSHLPPLPQNGLSTNPEEETEAFSPEKGHDQPQSGVEEAVQEQEGNEYVDEPCDEPCNPDFYDVPPLSNKGIFARPFSFKGRITRMEYALSLLAVPLTFLLFSVISPFYEILGGETASSHILKGFLFILLWLGVAQGVKRCHDTGHCGWFVYIPFYAFYLFFAKSRPEVNRYGEPANIRTTEKSQKEQIGRGRRHAINCTWQWLVFSPLYIWYATKHHVQKLTARIIMLICSPLVLGLFSIIGTTTTKVHETNSVETYAAEAIDIKVTGVEIPDYRITRFVHRNGNGTSEFTLQVTEPLSDKFYKELDKLAEKPSSHWEAASGNSGLGEDDYGYFREDYPDQEDSVSVSLPNEMYRFDRMTDLKGNPGKSRVVLSIERGNDDIRVSVTPLTENKETKE